jgi:hypothetical protein
MPATVSAVSSYAKVLGFGMLFLACMRRSAAKANEDHFDNLSLGIYLLMLHLKPLLLIQKVNPIKWFLWLSWGLPIIPVGLWAILAPYNCKNGYSYDQNDSNRVRILSNMETSPKKCVK